MLKFWGNKKLLFKWSISYLLLLGLTILVNIGAYVIVEKRIVDMNNRNAIEVLEHQKQSVDELASSLLDTSYNISLNTDVRNLALNTSVIDESNRYDFFNIMEKVKSYYGIDSYFENVLIYFNKVDYIAGNMGTASAGQYYDFYYSNKKMSKNDWYSILSANHFGDFVDFSAKYEEPGKGNMLFLYSLYGNERFKPYATIITEVAYSDFFSGNYDSRTERMFIVMDKEQNIILADQNTDMEYTKGLLKNNKVSQGITDYGDVVTVSVESNNDDWSYVHIISKKEFRKSINESRFIIIICNVLCIGILSWLAFALSNSNYKPLQKIIDVLDNGAEDIKTGEFQYINRKISEILMENKYISQKKQKQEAMLRDVFLLKLLNNDPLPKNKNEIFEELDIFFPYDSFICVLLCIELSEDMFFDNENDDADTAYQLARVVLTNILDEKLDTNYFKYYCDMDSTLCMIVNTSKKENREELYETICSLHEVVLKNFNIKFVAGISEVHESGDNLYLCYNEAKAGIDYRFFEKRNVVKYEEIAQTESNGYYYPHTQEERLIRMIKVGDLESCMELLDEIFDKNFMEREISAEQVKYFLSELVATVEKNFGSQQEDITELADMAKSMKNSEIPLSVIKQKIYHTIVNLCHNRNNEKNSRIIDMVDKVKDYINTNYSDIDLNVNTLAQRFSITSSYMSTVFKKNTQVGLQEYIMSIRIEHAKRILSITDYTIDKVAVMVGYANSRSFSRAFSKYVGISPGKYKEMNETLLSEKTEK